MLPNLVQVTKIQHVKAKTVSTSLTNRFKKCTAGARPRIRQLSINGRYRAFTATAIFESAVP